MLAHDVHAAWFSLMLGGGFVARVLSAVTHTHIIKIDVLSMVWLAMERITEARTC